MFKKVLPHWDVFTDMGVWHPGWSWGYVGSDLSGENEIFYRHPIDWLIRFWHWFREWWGVVLAVLISTVCFVAAFIALREVFI